MYRVSIESDQAATHYSNEPTIHNGDDNILR